MRLPNTKAELLAAIADLPDNTLVAVAGEYGNPVNLEIDRGVVLVADGPNRPYVMFSARYDEDDD